MDIQTLLSQIKSYLDSPLVKLGDTQITLWTLVYFVVLLLLLFYLAGRLRRWLVEKLLVRTKLEIGARQAVGSITRYVFLLVGLLVILQSAGVNLTALNVIAGAVGIGVGFGLQNIANNFISGVIILFERPIKVGDRIVVGNVEGDVTEIGARSTTVLTNDNIAIIVPNSKFITENVVNLKYKDDTVRFSVPVGVAYGSDVRLVEKLLLQAAQENPDVLDDPKPVAQFMAFGDSALQFELRVWSATLTSRSDNLVSALNFAIHDLFKAHGIEIPFPQRDLHIRSGAVEFKNSAMAADD
jgi:small-conductance mechanosensitive channel